MRPPFLSCIRAGWRLSCCKEDNDKLKQPVRGKAMRSNARGGGRGRYAVGSQGSLISCVHNMLWETVMPATILSSSLKAATRLAGTVLAEGKRGKTKEGGDEQSCKLMVIFRTDTLACNYSAKQGRTENLTVPSSELFSPSASFKVPPMPGDSPEMTHVTQARTGRRPPLPSNNTITSNTEIAQGCIA